MYTHPACAQVQTAAPDGCIQTRCCKNSKARIYSNWKKNKKKTLFVHLNNCIGSPLRFDSQPSATLNISSDRVTFALYIYRKKKYVSPLWNWETSRTFPPYTDTNYLFSLFQIDFLLCTKPKARLLSAVSAVTVNPDLCISAWPPVLKYRRRSELQRSLRA